MKSRFLILMLISMLLLAGPVLAHTGEDDYAHHSMMMWGDGMPLFSWLFGALVLIALILLIVWLVKQVQKK